VHIAIDDLQGAEIVAFLEAHVAQLRSLSPPESSHALDLAGH
jgi:putative acetyltransferase